VNIFQVTTSFVTLRAKEGTKMPPLETTESLLLSNPRDFYIPSETIQNRVGELAADLTERYHDREITVLTVLKGAKPFADDLTQKMEHPALIQDSVRAKSYEGTQSNGNLRILKKPDTDISGKHVIIAEDILDTRLTISRVARWLDEEYSPASLMVASLLEKPERRMPDTDVDAEIIVGFRIANKFVVGYGLDYDEQYRDLPYITTCEQQPNGLWTPRIPDEYA
jgi:hypoxanthine phosphoribosyltransferase